MRSARGDVFGWKWHAAFLHGKCSSLPEVKAVKICQPIRTRTRAEKETRSIDIVWRP